MKHYYLKARLLSLRQAKYKLLNKIKKATEEIETIKKLEVEAKEELRQAEKRQKSS